MIVIVIAHSKVERFEDPENAAYDRYTPRLHKAATSLLCEWVDAVLLCALRAHVPTGESPESARQREGYSRTPRVSIARWNLKEGSGKSLN